MPPVPEVRFEEKPEPVYAFAGDFGSGVDGEAAKRELSGDAGFQLDAAAFDADGVFDFAAALVLKLLGLLPDEAFEILQAWRVGFFAGFAASLDQLVVERIYLFLFVLGVREGQRKRGAVLRPVLDGAVAS